MPQKPKPPSKSEINGWLKDANLEELVGDSTFADYLSGVITTQIAAQSDAIYERMRAAMTGTPSPIAIEKARNLANQQAERLARNIAIPELNKMGKVIADGIANGDGPREIAKSLDMVRGLDSNRAKTYENYRKYLDTLKIDEKTYNARLERMFQKLLKDRKETIAQAEQRKATSGANYEEALARGAKEHRWMTVSDGRVRKQHAANEAQGWIPIKEAFQDGEMTPGEPNCRCTIAYRTYATPESDRTAREQAARTAAAIQAEEDAKRTQKQETPETPETPKQTKAQIADPKENIRKWESEHANDDIESAVIYTKDGRLLAETTGDKDQVSLKDVNLDDARGGILTHNHPPQTLPDGTKILGGPFSTQDLVFAAGRELKEIRVRDARYEYSAKIPKRLLGDQEQREKWIKNMISVSKRLSNEMEANVSADIKKGKPPLAVAAKWSHWKMNQLAERCGFEYTRVRI